MSKIQSGWKENVFGEWVSACNEWLIANSLTRTHTHLRYEGLNHTDRVLNTDRQSRIVQLQKEELELLQLNFISL